MMLMTLPTYHEYDSSSQAKNAFNDMKEIHDFLNNFCVAMGFNIAISDERKKLNVLFQKEDEYVSLEEINDLLNDYHFWLEHELRPEVSTAVRAYL